MGNERYFDQNVYAYERYRPTYTAKLFEDIIRYANITSDSNILEIGCGTGNATLPFIKTGAKVTAVELGKNLSLYIKDKFSQYPNFDVINTAFEDFATDQKYDLIFAATAFHWLTPDYAYLRCKELLAHNGVLATFWNTPRISPENQRLFCEVQELYAKYMPSDNKDVSLPQDSAWYHARCKRLSGYFETYGYQNTFFEIYRDERVFSADSYIGLLHTYSDHMALPVDTRKAFFDQMHTVIEKHGKVHLIDTIDLHMGQNR